ncbi:hypothetical protein SAMN04488118_10598 [Epibacterium ulvae]|uniref:Uncharacterized protein n=1 Tax=Epibacterium ulvae TaxID=1156985 RepID=A0A1G5QPT7_9RHOB|nr:hypothetical protein [Epibacterium ulvae]SCZ63646.1 hypothetical protein SAMN04488118_10598 [Epibacterium ulvae]
MMWYSAFSEIGSLLTGVAAMTAVAVPFLKKTYPSYLIMNRSRLVAKIMFKYDQEALV